MIFKDYLPCPALCSYVQCYRVRHFIIPRTIERHSKPYPVRPEHCMVFYPRGFEITEMWDNTRFTRSRSVITGQFTHLINRSTPCSEFLIIMVVFKPGALHRVTGIPAKEMVDFHIDLESVFPREGRLVNERLNSCNDYREMISIIEIFLTGLIDNVKIESRPSDEVFNIILNNHQKYSLDWLATQSCLSPRQFERKAEQYIGISPKHFARISRFNQSYEMKLSHPNEDWLSVAVACGYHDYQHLVRDYKEFASATPNTLFAAESKVLERALGLNT